MIDIHNHIIYGFDDGSKDINETLEMLNIAVDDGISAIIATPHYFTRSNEYDLKIYDKRYEEITNIIKNEKLPLKLFVGNEIFLDEKIIQGLIEGSCKTLANSKYVLVEWYERSNINIIKQILFELKIKQYIPIIAHCERFINENEDLDFIYELSSLGCLLQVNARTIIKSKSRFEKKCINKLLSENQIHFIASDAHNSNTRKPMLLKAYNFIVKKYGKNMADNIFIDNPQKLINDEMIV